MIAEKRKRAGSGPLKPPKSIGIASGKEGEGATTMAIAAATYFNGIMRANTAVAELGGRKSFPDIASAYYGDSERSSFRLMDIDYYTVSDATELAWIYNRDYDCVVVDFGIYYEKYISELIRCSRKLVLGSLNLWRYDAYLKLCGYIREIPGGENWRHILSGDSEDIREHLKKEGVTGAKRIAIDNPYVIGSAQIEFFQNIFGD